MMWLFACNFDKCGLNWLVLWTTFSQHRMHRSSVQQVWEHVLALWLHVPWIVDTQVSARKQTSIALTSFANLEVASSLTSIGQNVWDLEQHCQLEDWKEVLDDKLSDGKGILGLRWGRSCKSTWAFQRDFYSVAQLNTSKVWQQGWSKVMFWLLSIIVLATTIDHMLYGLMWLDV